jgi:hypothetical protein
MPLPMSILPIEAPVTTTELSTAVERALVKTGVIAANEFAREVLNEHGFTVEDSLLNLGNLSRTARDSVRLSATKDILDIHGLQFRREETNHSKPTVTFNVQTESGTVNMNTLFAPER